MKCSESWGGRIDTAIEADTVYVMRKYSEITRACKVTIRVVILVTNSY